MGKHRGLANLSQLSQPLILLSFAFAQSGALGRPYLELRNDAAMVRREDSGSAMAATSGYRGKTFLAGISGKVSLHLCDSDDALGSRI